MKNLLIILLFVFTCGTSVSQEIEETVVDNSLPMLTSFYNGPFEDAIKEAKKNNKYIFIDFGATWCSPCHKMDQETFTDVNVANKLNADFIAIKVDADSFSGMDLADLYKVSEFPTYVFLDKSGKIMGKSKGFFPPNYFLKEIDKNTAKPIAKKTNQTTSVKKKKTWG